MAKVKYYAVKVGMTPGVYLTWEECKSQVTGYSGALYKSFPTMEEAREYAGVTVQEVPPAESGPEVGEPKAGAETSPAESGLEAKAGAAELQVESEPETHEIETEQEKEGAPLPPGTAVAYVDGSYHVGTGEYSCGIVFMVGDREIHIAKRGENSEYADMRNVAGEILGAELAMRRAVESGIRKLTIYHDYQGIASWCLGEWKTNKAGTRAYKEYYDSIRDLVEIRFVKVKGHSGDRYNDLADELAKMVIF